MSLAPLKGKPDYLAGTIWATSALVGMMPSGVIAREDVASLREKTAGLEMPSRPWRRSCRNRGAPYLSG